MKTVEQVLNKKFNSAAIRWENANRDYKESSPSARVVLSDIMDSAEVELSVIRQIAFDLDIVLTRSNRT